MTNAIITKTYNDSTVLLFREDGYFNMTKAAKAFGKRLDHFWAAPTTIELLAELKKESPESGDYFETARGYHGGTWAHPELAVEFARWLDVKFARWCNAVIKDILTGAAQVNIVKPEQSEILKMPTTLLEAGKLWIAAMEQAEVLKLENVQQAQALSLATPKAEFYDALTESGTTFTPTSVANMLNLPEYKSGKKVNELMQEIGWQYKKGTHWYATTEASACGLKNIS